jgi:hypothetical protein
VIGALQDGMERCGMEASNLYIKLRRSSWRPKGQED